jgi:hypothetical protein
MRDDVINAVKKTAAMLLERTDSMFDMFNDRYNKGEGLEVKCHTPTSSPAKPAATWCAEIDP